MTFLKKMETTNVDCITAHRAQIAAQRAKFAKKVHKPPLGVIVINFELNWFNGSIWVPWNPSDPKKS